MTAPAPSFPDATPGVPPGAAPDDRALALRAGAAAADASAAFAQIRGRIAEIRTASDSVARLGAALAEAVAPADGAADGGASRTGHLEATASDAAALQDALAESALIDACEILSARLSDARRSAAELGVISTMTKVALGRSGAATGSMRTYSETLESLVSRLSDVVAAAQARAAPILDRRREAARAAAAAAADLARALRGLSRRRADAEALGRRRDVSLDALCADAAGVAPALGAIISRLIPFLQFVDELEQRIEHAARILDAADAPDAAARAAAPTLFAAQIASLAGDYAVRSDELASALADLESAADARSASLLTHDAAPLRAAFAAEEEVNGLLAGAVAEALSHVGETQAGLEAVTAAATAAAEAVADFEGLMRDLKLAACNATVASARASNRGGALNFLAGCVAETSKLCARHLDAAAETLKDIDRLLPTDSQQKLSRRLDSIQEDQRAIVAAAQDRKRRLNREADTRRELAGVLDMLRASAAESGAAVEAANAPGRALAEMAEALNASRIGAHPPGAFDWALALYSTTAERETHRALAPDAAADAAVEADAAADDDELDGFLL